MKREEAIKRIKDHMRVHKMGQPPHIKISEALYMAIDALEQKKDNDANASGETITIAGIRNNLAELVKPHIGEVVPMEFITSANWMIQRLVEKVQAYEKAPGSTSDGYHTFDELYRHRGILFALICADHKEIAWKTLKHSDGTMYPGMFLCGIDTPYGQATYHMNLDPFWNLIQVQELPIAPEWDGHTPDMALNRIAAMAADRFVPLEHGIVED